MKAHCFKIKFLHSSEPETCELCKILPKIYNKRLLTWPKFVNLVKDPI